MRICFVSKEVAGVWGAGIGTYVAEAGKALTRAGHEVWLITKDHGEAKRPLLDTLPGFSHVLVNGENCADWTDKHLFHGVPHYKYSVVAHQTIQKTGVEFDYIEFPDYEAEGLVPVLEQNLLGSYPNTLLGIMLHSPTWECLQYDRQTHRMTMELSETCSIEEHAIRNARFRTSPSTRLLEMVRDRLGLDEPAGEVLRYPMELPADAPEPPAPRSSLDQLQFLYYGRIEPRKGVAELLEAFRQLPELELTLIGGDTPYSPYGSSLREHLKATAPANVRFLDAIPREELLERIQTVDVCVFPSLWENFPNACIEALAAARVVIGGQAGGMSEMITHGESGFLVNGADPDHIAQVIRKDLGSSLGRLDEIGRAAAQGIRRLVDPSVYTERLESLVSEGRRHLIGTQARASSSKRVSVVIPFYRDEEWVETAVASAEAQTHTDTEVLVVNDGSPLPNADEILGQVADRHPGLRVLHKANGGLGSARNRGADEATGDYVLFLDADDRIRPEYAEICAGILDREQDLDFLVPFTQFADFDNSEDLGIYNPMPFGRDRALIINRFGTSGAFFRRSLFSTEGLRYDERLISYEDWALWMDIARQGRRGEIVPRILYDYRIRSGSMISADGRPNHLPLLGLLIEDHFPAVSAEERRVLVTLNHVWGGAAQALEQMRGEDRPRAPTAQEEAERLEAREPHLPQVRPTPPPLRYRVVDALSERARKFPVVARMLRSVLKPIGKLVGVRDEPDGRAK